MTQSGAAEGPAEVVGPTPPLQPAPPAYYPGAVRPAPGDLLPRPVLFLMVFVGGLLIWLAYLLIILVDLQPASLSIVAAVGMTGAFLGFLFSLLGGIAGRDLFPHQRLGLLLLAAAFLLTGTFLVAPFIAAP